MQRLRWPRGCQARRNDGRSGDEGELLEEVTPAIVDPRCGDDSWHTPQGEDKINHNQDGCARFRGAAEVNGSAAEDEGNSCGIDKGTRLMPAVVVAPDQNDEAEGERRQSKHVTAEVRSRRWCGHLFFSPFTQESHDAGEPIAGDVALSNRAKSFCRCKRRPP